MFDTPHLFHIALDFVIAKLRLVLDTTKKQLRKDNIALQCYSVTVPKSNCGESKINSIFIYIYINIEVFLGG